MIKTYKIIITDNAKNDINNNYNYVFYNLKNPNAANNIYDETRAKINSLKHMPERYPIIERCKYNNKDVHKALVSNYLLLYTISNDEVVILRVPHSRRAYSQLLK